ncbi:hypothetical protein [Rhodoplanes sp. Z2-YC6860]|uniref:hypothetical protein n=1 Tax=Rhodoplanes sp. Z2-YC6860 TaxID=674703 RepID=UPI0012ED47C2|nr:hypothetical protein [Rhodoplanes sp. Z2-YC6860]
MALNVNGTSIPVPEDARVSLLACPLVGRTKPVGHAERREDRRDNDRQHDAKRVEQNLAFGFGNRSFGIENALAAAAQ